LESPRALNITPDLASGLVYAHETGFVHRDVKAGNIRFRAIQCIRARRSSSMSSPTMAGNVKAHRTT